jgi:hypothetical protein
MFSWFLSSVGGFSPLTESRFTRLIGRIKSAMKADDIGRDSSEKPECLDRLMHAHPAAAQYAAAFGSGSSDEFGIDRSVDDVGGPMR